MSGWERFRALWLGNPFLWWITLILAWVLLLPLARRFRLWRERRRFLAARGPALEDPGNAQVRFELAQLWAESRAWAKVAPLATEAVRAAAESPLYDHHAPYGYLCLLGRALLGLGRAAEAVAVFRAALSATSHRGHAEARFGLARALHRGGDPRAALAEYRAIEEDLASSLEYYFRRAQAAADAGDSAAVAEARAAFRRTAAALPPFAGKGRLRWRLAFLLFPLSRHLG